ncbi:MAG TPA: hypothetical protein H9681_12530 [Firmicutes bacterium]|nr:hypothetical protein [Bacillota bacterium]
MTVKELEESLGLTPVCVSNPDREVTGAYVGDLLSWVMGRAPADSVWLTIMSNVNVCAVASLADVACVILAEGVTPDPPAKTAAETRGLNMFTSTKTSYQLAKELALLGI